MTYINGEIYNSPADIHTIKNSSSFLLLIKSLISCIFQRPESSGNVTGFDLVVILRACVLLGATVYLYPSYDGLRFSTALRNMDVPHNYEIDYERKQFEQLNVTENKQYM